MAKATPVTGTLGAEVEGVDLSKDLEPSVIDWIASALVEHKVLFFRDQKLDRQQHLAFGRRFGPLEVHPFAFGNDKFGNDGSDPELLVIESKPGSPISGTDIWHSDVSFREDTERWP